MASLNFKGKQLVQNFHLTVKYHELVPDKKKSLTEHVSLNDNLIIHGDNLLALKALLPTYAGKVKCIYIDPPYNTGNESWVYNDKVNSPMMQEWLGKVVDKEDMTRHDKWLCMMMPRLKLLRELLSDDGAVFISIDDNEVHHLRMLLDEIFGSQNFVTNIVWQKKYAASNDAVGIPAMHDHIVAYQKTDSFQRKLLPRTEKQDKAYKYDDNDGKGLWRSDNILVKSFSKAYVFPIVNPNTGKEHWPPKGSCWRTGRETIITWIQEGRVFFGRDGKGSPQLKRYLNEVQQGIVPTTWWPFDEAGHNDEANKEVGNIFGGGKSIFDTPKPLRLIQRIFSIASDKNSIILDSFAGSGTTAHATLALNNEDGGNRKFILVEMEDYANTITAERMRRVIKGVKSAKDDNLKNGLAGTFSYFELGKPIEMDNILSGKNLPTYKELARYVFYTATGEEFDPSVIDEKKWFIGESKNYKVYLIYKQNEKLLRSLALTMDIAKSFGSSKTKKRLVFAPTKYLDQEHLADLKMEFAQLPFEIYRMAE